MKGLLLLAAMAIDELMKAASSEKAQPEMRDASMAANEHLEAMPYSRKGLIRQLEYEGYTAFEAAKAVDACGANWKEQALKSAELYQSAEPFSYDSLLQQLEFEGFTEEEAAYKRIVGLLRQHQAGCESGRTIFIGHAVFAQRID